MYRSKSFIGSSLLLASIALLQPTLASAQAYPNKPIRIIVGYTAGGGADSAARLAAQKLSENLGQSILVENRPGASGSIAIERVATMAPDGYTLLLLTSANVAQAALASKLPYDLERDFSPISMLNTGPYVLIVRTTLAAQNLKELLALAKAAPGKLNYGSSGIGGQAHFAGELVNSLADVRMTHIPYKGSSEFVTATAAGQIDLSFPSIPSALPLIEAGKLRALAVTSPGRSALLPNIPSLEESGLRGYDLAVWYGLLAPKGVPRDIIAKLNSIVVASFGSADVRDLLLKQGSEPRTNSPEQFAVLIKRELAQNVALIKAAGIKPE